MNRYIATDPYRCTGCDKCREACSEGHRSAGRQGAPRLSLVEGETNGALCCHHCESAPCLKVCPTDSMRRDADGCVRVDERRCIGCKLCACACPFGAIRMGGTGVSGVAGVSYPYPVFPAGLHPMLRWRIGESLVAVKCDLCDCNGGRPRCVEACDVRALRLVAAEDLSGEMRGKRVFSGGFDLAALEAIETKGKGESR